MRDIFRALFSKRPEIGDKYYFVEKDPFAPKFIKQVVDVKERCVQYDMWFEGYGQYKTTGSNSVFWFLMFCKPLPAPPDSAEQAPE